MPTEQKIQAGKEALPSIKELDDRIAELDDRIAELDDRITELDKQKNTLSNAKQKFLADVKKVVEDYLPHIKKYNDVSLEFNNLDEATQFIKDALLIAKSDDGKDKSQQVENFEKKYTFASMGMSMSKSLDALKNLYKPHAFKRTAVSTQATRKKKSQSSQASLGSTKLNQNSSKEDKETFLRTVLDSQYTKLEKKTTNDSTNVEVKGYKLSMEESNFLAFQRIFTGFKDAHHDASQVDEKTIWNIIADPFNEFIQNLQKQLPENSKAIQRLRAIYQSGEKAINQVKSKRVLSHGQKRPNPNTFSSRENSATLKPLDGENNPTETIKPTKLLSNDKNRNILLEKLKAHTTKEENPWITKPKDLDKITKECEQITVTTSQDKDGALETGFIIKDDGITIHKNTPEDKVQENYKKAAKFLGECGFQLLEITAPLNNEASLLAAAKSIIAAGQIPVISPSLGETASCNLQEKIIAQLTEDEKTTYNAAKDKLAGSKKRIFEQKINENYSHLPQEPSNMPPSRNEGVEQSAQSPEASEQNASKKLAVVQTKNGNTVVNIKPMFQMKINSNNKTFKVLKHSIFGAAKKEITLNVKQSVGNYLLAKALIEANCKAGNKGDLEVAKALAKSDDIKATLERLGKMSWYNKLNPNKVYSPENIKEAMQLGLMQEVNVQFKNEFIAMGDDVIFADIEDKATEKKDSAKRFRMFKHEDGHYTQNEPTKKVNEALHSLRKDLVNSAQNDNSPASPRP